MYIILTKNVYECYLNNIAQHYTLLYITVTTHNICITKTETRGERHGRGKTD